MEVGYLLGAIFSGQLKVEETEPKFVTVGIMPRCFGLHENDGGLSNNQRIMQGYEVRVSP